MNLNLLASPLYRDDINKVLTRVDFSKFKNKKILITGGLGLVCSSIVDVLICANLEHNLNISIDIADINKELFLIKYSEYAFVSFIHYDATKNFFFDKRFDYVIVGAGVANPNLYVTKPVETMLSNINGLLSILSCQQDKPVEKIVYISSSEVYGIKNGFSNFTEDEYGFVDETSIRSSYAVAKKACEMICKSYFTEYNLPICIARPGHIFGPSASINDKRISSEFCFRAANGADLTIKGNGQQIRSYCYTLDCAYAFLLLLLKGVNGESYNIGSTEETSIKKLVEYMSIHSNIPMFILGEEKTSVSNPMNNSCLDISKICKIGFANIFKCREAIEHTIDIIREVYFK